MNEDFAICRVTGTAPAAAKNVTFDSMKAERQSFHPALTLHVVKKGYNGGPDKLLEYVLDCMTAPMAAAAKNVQPGTRCTALCHAVGKEQMDTHGNPKDALFLLPYALHPAAEGAPDAADLILCGTVTKVDIITFGRPPHTAEYPRITITVDRGNGKTAVFPVTCFTAATVETAAAMNSGDRILCTVRPNRTTVKKDTARYINLTYSAETIFPPVGYTPAAAFPNTPAPEEEPTID